MGVGWRMRMCREVRFGPHGVGTEAAWLETERRGRTSLARLPSERVVMFSASARVEEKSYGGAGACDSIRSDGRQ